MSLLALERRKKEAGNGSFTTSEGWKSEPGTWKKKQVFSSFVDKMTEGQGSPESASAGVLTGEEVLSRLGTAAQSAGSAVSEWCESKRVKQPEVFSPKSIDEEIAGWQEWSFVFLELHVGAGRALP